MKCAPSESSERKRPEPRLLPATLVLILSLAFVAAAIAAPQIGRNKGATSKTSKPTKSPFAVRRKPPPPARSPFVVLGFNDIGIRFLYPDFSEMCILTPSNNLHAQVIDRSGEEPRIVTTGIDVKYSIPGNTKSSTKTNFWQYAQSLFGLASPLTPDVGLTGHGLSGVMAPTLDGDFVATGIPITPITDAGVFNPFQLGLIQVVQNGVVKAQTQAVVPVSWEMSCNICHTGGPGVSVARDILSKHDAKHLTTLVAQTTKGQPVLCASCHADTNLKQPGVPGVKSMSHAMHGSHASLMGPAASVVNNACYACHPGKQTQMSRDVHFLKGMTCTDCHTGGMPALGNVNRKPWADQPKCSNCHKKPGFAYEEPGKLYKDSRGHNGVKCNSCHGSPHAITPTAVAADNVQAITLQGHPGTINDCKVCHSRTPDDRFNHTLTDD